VSYTNASSSSISPSFLVCPNEEKKNDDGGFAWFFEQVEVFQDDDSENDVVDVDEYEEDEDSWYGVDDVDVEPTPNIFGALAIPPSFFWIDDPITAGTWTHVFLILVAVAEKLDFNDESDGRDNE